MLPYRDVPLPLSTPLLTVGWEYMHDTAHIPTDGAMLIQVRFAILNLLKEFLARQSMYALRILVAHILTGPQLYDVVRATIVTRLLYAAPA